MDRSEGRAHLIKSGWETLSVPKLGREGLQGRAFTRLAEGGSSDSMAMAWGVCPLPDAGMAVMWIWVWKWLPYEREKGWWHFRLLVDGGHGVQQDCVLQTQAGVLLDMSWVTTTKPTLWKKIGVLFPFTFRTGRRLCTYALIHQFNSIHTCPHGIFDTVYFN